MEKNNPKFETNPEIRSVRAKIQGFLDYVDGSFNINEVYISLDAKTADEKNAIRQALFREKQAGTIEKAGSHGLWRKIESQVEWFDLSEVRGKGPEPLKVVMPLGLHGLISLYPGDMIVIAGRTSCGKSSFALEFASSNLAGQKVKYCSNELTIESVQERAGLDGIDLFSLKGLSFTKRYDNFHDLVEPGAINIVDYLSAPGSGNEPQYYSIPHLLTKIHNKLDGKGLVLVCIQKDPGRAAGEGGFKTLHRSNLYMTLDQDAGRQYWANIQKCKVRPDIEGYRMKYRPNPFELRSLSDWIPEGH